MAASPNSEGRPPSDGPVRLLLIEPDASLRADLGALLASDPRAVGRVGAAESVDAALPRAAGADVDVALLDGSVAELERFIAAVRGAGADVPTLLLARIPDEAQAFAALRAGAAGYVCAAAGLDRIVDALRAARDGGVVLEPPLSRAFWARLASDAALGERPALDAGEIELLELLARGLTNPEVGRVLGVQRRTVRTRLSHLYRKLGVASHAEAVARALRWGIVRP